MSAEIPIIRPVRWASLREALPNEAAHFTPWLAQNLYLLAETLGLEELELVRTESAVESFRVDVLATGTDASGEEIEVVIENQYGKSDHDHLGKLVTYAAQSHSETERVLGVWLTEEPTDAHIAAVEFLNRISTESVGWILIAPKLIPSPDGYYIHFEVHAEPNTFLRQAPKATARSVPPERVEFMQTLHGVVERPLREMGYRNVYAHPQGRVIRAYFPSHLPIADWAEIRVLASKDRFRVVLFIRGDVAADVNARVLAAIRERHGDTIEAAMPDPPIEWHAEGAKYRSDHARYTWQGHGYANADPAEAGQLVVDFARVCYETLAGDGRDLLPDPAELQDRVARADAATIMAIAAEVREGEWTTYGDLSTVATGNHTAAMTVGQTAANNPDFPKPHRLLQAQGTIPDDWASGDGGGPEVCRQYLEAEGVRFRPDGSADPAQRVSIDTLRQRWNPEEDDGLDPVDGA